MPDGVVFAIAGAKGGVGKTTTSINLSAVLTEFGHSVVLVELDIAMANVGDFLDIDVNLEEGGDPTLHEVLSRNARAADAIYEAPGGFDVVPSGATLGGYANADIAVAETMVEALRQQYGVVILDTGAGIGAETILPLKLADETILVSSPRVASVRDTTKTRDLVYRVDGAVAGVVFSKSGSGRSPPVERIAGFLSVDLLGHIPEDSAVASAQDVGQPVVVAHSESGAAKAYGALGSRIHDRVGPLRAKRVREQERAEQTASKGQELDSTDSDESGFNFVSDDDESDKGDEATDETAVSDEDGTTDSSGPSTPAVGNERTEPTTDPAAAGGDAAGNGQSATNGTTADMATNGTTTDTATNGTTTDAATNGTTTDTATNGTTDVATNGTTADAVTETGRSSVGRTTGLSTPNQSAGGATDEEIAKRLEEVEGESAAEGDAAQEDGGAVENGEDSGVSESGDDDAADESRESAAKRFIDRAIGIVDRRGD